MAYTVIDRVVRIVEDKSEARIAQTMLTRILSQHHTLKPEYREAFRAALNGLIEYEEDMYAEIRRIEAQYVK